MIITIKIITAGIITKRMISDKEIVIPKICSGFVVSVVEEVIMLISDVVFRIGEVEGCVVYLTGLDDVNRLSHMVSAIASS